jgi:hypothetical protein
MKMAGLYRQRRVDFVVWGILCSTVGLLAILYLGLGLRAGDGSLVMPLDDTYIHFQYARQMAEGHPYEYITGDKPTSGATSFLYTPLLATGYLLGLHGLKLAYWAVGWGGLFFLLSAWLIYRLILLAVSAARLSHYCSATGLMLAFVVSGPFLWATFSGMETALFVFAVLLALYAYCRFLRTDTWMLSLQEYTHLTVKARQGGGEKTPDQQFSGEYAARKGVQAVALAGAFAALARPEGAIIAMTLGVILTRYWRKYPALLLMLLVAMALQPAVNLLVTGTASASGSEAKSILYNTTIPFSERVETVLDYWWRLWRELLAGRNPVDGRYIPSLIVLLALFTALVSIRISWQQRIATPALLAAGWLLFISAGVATLETAFWHFKRYQLPLMALMFPLAGWAMVWLATQGRWRWLAVGLAMALPLVSAGTTLEYARRYFDNVYVVQNQQVAMARWVQANLPENARIGVHDVGVMAYLGNRKTYDLVGLTTDGVAQAWRQGAGAIYDTMAARPDRPNYFAVYHDIQSLPLLEQVEVFGEELVRFTLDLPENTVASATGTQIVSQADWSGDFSSIRQPATEGYLGGTTKLLAALNIGNLASEETANYRWWNAQPTAGFATVVRRLPYVACTVEPCMEVDGARLLTGGEQFDLPENVQYEGFLVILRVHAQSFARLKAGCTGEPDVAVVPNRPGEWVEIPFWLPASATRFCLEIIGVYEPARYWIYGITRPIETAPVKARAIFREPGDGREFRLAEVGYGVRSGAITIEATWYSAGDLTQDGKVFVHLYNDPEQPPVRQLDVWPGEGALPPANWLPGSFAESYTLPLDGIPAGLYRLALGFYEPNSQKRYTVVDQTGETDRLFLGEIEID